MSLYQHAVADSTWLMTDPWEALYTPVAVNFTDVIARFKRYIARWRGFEPQIAYVVGADNAMFGLPFEGVSNVIAVCLERGIPTSRLRQARACLRDTLFVDRPHNRLCSTGLRRAQPLPRPRTGVYVVRDDLGWVGQRLGPGLDLQGFRRGLLGILAAEHPELRIMPLEEQQVMFSGEGIFLDICSSMRPQLGVSRVFEMCDGQVKAASLALRPGQQSDLIFDPALPLVDDDIVSGYGLPVRAAMGAVGRARILVAQVAARCASAGRCRYARFLGRCAPLGSGAQSWGTGWAGAVHGALRFLAGPGEFAQWPPMLACTVAAQRTLVRG